MAEKMDILNRQPFVDRLIDIVRLLADNHRGCTFAIDGAWGCGKTFILEMFEKQISLFQNPAAAGDRYALFHYNCWQYDYYEEPAIAICASIREQANEAARLFPEPTPMLQSIINLGMKIGKELLSNYVETKFGVNAKAIVDACDAIRTGKKRVVKDRKDENVYDTYFEFRQVLQKTRDDLSKLAEEKPIIIVVDELDRCLPEYAITVLERLHHLFDRQENIIVVLAIDKTRLSSAVHKVFGIERDSVPDFLRKYISFSLEVGKGSISDMFWERHSEYLSMFDKASAEEMDELNKLATALFADVDARVQEKIMENCATLHKLACKDITDLSLLYFELIYQTVWARTQSKGYLHHLADLNKSQMPSFEEKLGKNTYDYLKILEKTSTSQRSQLQVNNKTYKILQNTASGRAFWLFARIHFPLSGNICHQYAMEKLVCEDRVVVAAQLFHELARLMK